MGNQKYTDTFSRLRVRLHRIASSILKNEDDADDALQEAFCRLWASPSKPVTREMADGAAILTVKRICIDSLRNRNFHIDKDLPDDFDVIENVESVWDNDSLKELEKSLLLKIPPLQRSVFEMVSKGIDYDIIALRMGISEPYVRKLICRARQTLRSEYKKLIDK